MKGFQWLRLSIYVVLLRLWLSQCLPVKSSLKHNHGKILNLEYIEQLQLTIYNVCHVTLSVYPHRAGLKNMPGHGGNRTYDLWNTSPMLCQLSYTVRSVRVCDITNYASCCRNVKRNR